jgi:PqqD family protein of HPr-rel-A system
LHPDDRVRLETPSEVTLEAVGPSWVAYSGLSGETHLLNDEAAALVEVFGEAPRTVSEAAQVVAADAQTSPHLIEYKLQEAAVFLRVAGLIRPVLSRGRV